MIDWILRFVKGIFIGSGFILPGVSGGALAAVFGIYERLISFISNIRKNFMKNLIYFIPVGLGGIAGVLIFSLLLNTLFASYKTEMVWFFIGCIVGTLPTLWKQAAKKGRQGKHYVIMFISFAIGFVLMLFLSQSAANIPQNFGTWIMAGGLIGLGVVVPGLSPSNLLIFFGMYAAMTKGISSFDFGIIVPLVIGGAAVLLLFSKLMEYALGKAYAGIYHIILGVVLASTVMIIPTNVNYLTPHTFIYAGLCAAGIALGYFMGMLEKKYKTEE